MWIAQSTTANITTSLTSDLTGTLPWNPYFKSSLKLYYDINFNSPEWLAHTLGAVTSIKDLSGNGHDGNEGAGLAENRPTWTSPNTYITYDGTNDFTIVDDTSALHFNDFTVAARVRMKAPLGQYERVIGCGNNNGSASDRNGWYLGTGFDPNKWAFFRFVPPSTTSNYEPVDVTVDAWTTIICTHTSSTNIVTINVNGTTYTSTPRPGTITYDVLNPLTKLASNAATETSTSGSAAMDLACIVMFNEVLTGSDITGLKAFLDTRAS